MISGNKQPKWDIYEAVILLDGYLEWLNTNQPKTKIIKRISADLRRMATNRGTEIDDIYRNENGISYQIQSIDSAYKGKKVYVPATRLFEETKCSISDNRVVLYALYKFAEKCNLDKEFHISYLYDENVERDGVSPVRLFGLYDEEELKSILLGLSSAYPEFINATFTNDLQTITLRDKTSNDVLNLFKEEL